MTTWLHRGLVLPTLALAALVMFAGCGSLPESKAVELSKVLREPYRLRLSLDRPKAHPGEMVYASIEFENTGRKILWIPRRREVFFGFEQRTGSGSLAMENWGSSCDGLEFVPVRPGKKASYEKGFVAPDMRGEISVYITADRKVSARLLIE